MRKLRVFGVPWHCPHQWDLAHAPWIERYDLLVNPWRLWAENTRPIPEKVYFVSELEQKNGKLYPCASRRPNHIPDRFHYVGDAEASQPYDLAILHIDQQVIESERMGKRRLYDAAYALARGHVPIVVINHMTPYSDRLDTTQEVIGRVNLLVGNAPMVVNSFEAQAQWGKGTAIIHGMEASEWWDYSPKAPRIITVLSPAGMEKAYRRKLLIDTFSYLEEAGLERSKVWVGSDKGFSTWDDYREYLARSLIYFNPTWQSPRPRARTEAMLSGACVVTTRHHDADTFIEDGKNGFLVSDNPKACAKLLFDLATNRYQECVRIGQAGKETAKKLFNRERFYADWEQFLEKEVHL